MTTRPSRGASPPSGVQIKRWRTERGLTLANVAERSGLNVGYLSQIENDKASPSLGCLWRSPTRWRSRPPGSSSTTSRHRSWSGPMSARPASPRWAACRTSTGGRRATSRSSRSPANGRAGASGSHSHAGEEHHIVLRGRFRMTQGEHDDRARPRRLRPLGRHDPARRRGRRRRPGRGDAHHPDPPEGLTGSRTGAYHRPRDPPSRHLRLLPQGRRSCSSLQVERSSGPDGPEHDELLFIVIHQVYELWFKQLRHELGGVQRALEAGDTDTALHLLNRVLKILKTLVAQVDVLETMTPAPVPVVPRPARLGVRVPVGRLPPDRGDARHRATRRAAAAQPEGSAARRAIEARAGRRRRSGTSFLGLPRRARPRRSRRDPSTVPDERGPGRRSSRSTAATRTRRWSRSGWSTSTRASRSGATAT